MPLQSRGVCLEQPLPPLGEAVKVVCLTQSRRTIVLCFIVKMCMCRYNTGAGRSSALDDITVEMGELHSEKPAFAVEVCIIIV